MWMGTQPNFKVGRRLEATGRRCPDGWRMGYLARRGVALALRVSAALARLASSQHSAHTAFDS